MKKIRRLSAIFLVVLLSLAVLPLTVFAQGSLQIGTDIAQISETAGESGNPNTDADAMPSATPDASAMPSATPDASAMPSATPDASAMPSATPDASTVPSATPNVSPMPSASADIVSPQTAEDILLTQDTFFSLPSEVTVTAFSQPNTSAPDYPGLKEAVEDPTVSVINLGADIELGSTLTIDRALSIKSAGGNTLRLAASLPMDTRHFNLDSSKSFAADFNDLTLDGGGNCGGVSVSGGQNSITISNVVIQNCRASKGGGLSIDAGASVSLNNALIQKNKVVLEYTPSVTATYDVPGGGGIHNKGRLTMNNVTVSENDVSLTLAFVSPVGSFHVNASVQGGGIYSTGNLNGTMVVRDNQALIRTTANTQFDSNDVNIDCSVQGGGIYSTGSLTLPNGAVVSGNTVQTDSSMFEPHALTINAQGGGVYSMGSFNLQNARINHNTALAKDDFTSGISYEKKIQVQGGGIYQNGSTLNVKGGQIDGNVTSSSVTHGTVASDSQGGGVYSTGIFTLSGGGTISGNIAKCQTGTSDGGGVYSTGTFNMQSGEISNCTSQNLGGGVGSTGVCSLTGGEIKNNTGSGGAGGVWNNAGELTLDGSNIWGNNGSLSGGGIYSNGGKTIILSGKIFSNKGIMGGGVYNDGNSILEMSGGEITGNTASKDGPGVYSGMGGGVYNNPGATFTLSGGKISANTAKVYGGGVESGGTFIMNNGEISGNTALVSGGALSNWGDFTMNDGLISANHAGGLGDTRLPEQGGGIAMSTLIGGSPTAQLNGGRFSKNTTTGNGGAVFTDDYTILNIKADVVFTDNRAVDGYYMTDPTDIATYNMYVKTTHVTEPFTYAYNNFDINYTRGTKAVLYTVTFLAGANGKLSGGSPQETLVESGTAFAAVKMPTTLPAAHYLFSNWTLENGGTPPASVTADITLKANFTGRTYTVTFDGNGAGTQAQPRSMQVTYPVSQLSAMPTAPQRANYSFKEWSTSSNGLGTTFDETYVITGDMTVYAQWQAVPLPTPTATTQPTPEPTNGPEPTASLSPAPTASPASSASQTPQPTARPTTTITPSVSPAPTASPSATATATPTKTTTVPAIVTQEPPDDPPDNPLTPGTPEFYAQEREQTLDDIKAAGLPVVKIGDNEVPLFGLGFNSVWALLNLLLAITGGGIAVALTVSAFKRKKDEADMPKNEEPDQAAQKKKWALRIVGIIAGVAGIIFFLLTENVNHLMVVLVDNWTIGSILFATLSIAMAVIVRRKKAQNNPPEASERAPRRMES